MWRKQIQSLLEGQRMESHILEDPPNHDLEASKPTRQLLILEERGQLDQKLDWRNSYRKRLYLVLEEVFAQAL